MPGVRQQHGGFSRRTMLKGLFRGSAVAVALPWLEIFAGRTAKACDDGFPLRFGLFYWGNGNVPEYWVPGTEGYDWELSEILSPLADVKPWVSVVSGLSVKLPNVEPHTSGVAGLLTGRGLERVNDEYTFAAPTIDQLIAQEIGGETLFPSLQTGGTDCSGQSWSGPSSRNYAETDPYALYERLFGATFRAPGEEGLVDPSLGLRQSILDAVMEDITTLQSRVGVADKARLEQHLDGIRELETRLARLQEDPPSLAACVQPVALAVDFSDQDGRPQISARSRAMCDMIAMSFACDQTRVVGHYLTDPVADILFPDATAGHHSLTHDEADPQTEVRMITTQCVAELAYLLTALSNVNEGDATLLDHCVIMAASEISQGRTHSLDDMPLLICGGGCGAFKMNYHYRSYTQESASEAMLSVVRGMGIPAASYGADEGLATDGLSDIEA
jgi:hypothetical protein